MCVASKRIRCKQVLLWLAWGLAVAAVSLSMALGRVSVCDYVSINGDFQSYNVFRRILAGQTPYLDFVNYIGMAPVWINLPLVALNNTVLPPPFIELLLADTSDGLVCEPVIYQIFYAEGDDSILRTHAGAVWGRRNIGIVAEKDGDPSVNLIPLIAAFSKNIRHPMKDGDDFEADGRKFRMTDAKDGDEDILLMKER